MKSPGTAWYLVYVFCSVLLLSRGVASNGEEMYRYRDVDGTWILSDTPPPPGHETREPPAQKSPPPAPPPRPRAAPVRAVSKPKNVTPQKTSEQPPIRPPAQPPEGASEASDDRRETPDSIEIGPSSARVEAGRVIIEGTVHNRNHTRTLRSVTIIMMAYDRAGSLVGVPAVSPQPSDLAPGQMGTYSVHFPPHVHVYRYKPRVMWRE